MSEKMPNQKKGGGGWGGRSPPQRKREAQSWQSSCCFCCCCCCCFFSCCCCCCCCCCCLLLFVVVVVVVVVVFVVVVLIVVVIVFVVVIVVVIVFVVVLLVVLVVVLSPEHPKEKKKTSKNTCFSSVFLPYFFFFSLFSLSIFLYAFSFFLSFLSFFLSFLSFSFIPSFLFPFLFLFLFLLSFLSFLSFFFSFFSFLLVVVLLPFCLFHCLCCCNSNSCFCCSYADFCFCWFFWFFCCCCVLCCYVVKLGKAKKQKPKKKHPKKVEVLPGIFYKTSYGCMCQSYCFFWAVLLFFLVAQKHYKNRVFEDFDMLIFSFFGQKSRVNNLATVGSITWPHFFPKLFAKNVAKLLTLQFSHVFFISLFFSKISFSLQKEEYFWKTKNKNTKKKVAKLLTYGGQVISHSLYMSMCVHIYIYISLSRSLSLCLSLSLSLSRSLFLSLSLSLSISLCSRRRCLFLGFWNSISKSLSICLFYVPISTKVSQTIVDFATMCSWAPWRLIILISILGLRLGQKIRISENCHKLSKRLPEGLWSLFATLICRAKQVKKISRWYFVLFKSLVSGADYHFVFAASLRKTHVFQLLIYASPKFLLSPFMKGPQVSFGGHQGPFHCWQHEATLHPLFFILYWCCLSSCRPWTHMLKRCCPSILRMRDASIAQAQSAIHRQDACWECVALSAAASTNGRLFLIVCIYIHIYICMLPVVLPDIANRIKISNYESFL